MNFPRRDPRVICSLVNHFMKRTHPPDVHARFAGNLRHYHRSGANTQRSWDDWVDGVPTKSSGSKNWPKIIGIVVGIFALCGIIIGLIIELG